MCVGICEWVNVCNYVAPYTWRRGLKRRWSSARQKHRPTHLEPRCVLVQDVVQDVLNQDTSWFKMCWRHILVQDVSSSVHLCKCVSLHLRLICKWVSPVCICIILIGRMQVSRRVFNAFVCIAQTQMCLCVSAGVHLCKKVHVEISRYQLYMYSWYLMVHVEISTCTSPVYCTGRDIYMYISCLLYR